MLRFIILVYVADKFFHGRIIMKKISVFFLLQKVKMETPKNGMKSLWKLLNRAWSNILKLLLKLTQVDDTSFVIVLQKLSFSSNINQKHHFHVL